MQCVANSWFVAELRSLLAWLWPECNQPPCWLLLSTFLLLWRYNRLLHRCWWHGFISRLIIFIGRFTASSMMAKLRLQSWGLNPTSILVVTVFIDLMGIAIFPSGLLPENSRLESSVRSFRLLIKEGLSLGMGDSVLQKNSFFIGKNGLI